MENLNFKQSKMKYLIGTNACGNCRERNHHSCRPRLDGSLCTCSCDRATACKDEVRFRVAVAKQNGTRIPTVEEILTDLNNKFDGIGLRPKPGEKRRYIKVNR